MDYYHEYFKIEHERLTTKAGNLRNELGQSNGEAEAIRKLQEDVAWAEAARNAMRGRL